MRPDLKALIDRVRQLEALALAIYTRLGAHFKSQRELHDFWMSMARHEAAHVGALVLIGTLLDQSREDIRFDPDPRIIEDAADRIGRLHGEVVQPVAKERAFEIALELESLELEDVVLDLIHLLSDPAARDQAEQMLLHDLSDLSLMIEKHSSSDELLAKADALIEARVGQRESGRVG